MPMNWDDEVRELDKRLGRRATLDELIELSRTHTMTPEELEAQRQSWARANEPTGDARFD